MNMNKLNIAHPAVDYAYYQLQTENAKLSLENFEQLFEETYKCKIKYDDNYGISGHLYFEREKDLTFFLLKNESTI